jgi:hypothetical protein
MEASLGKGTTFLTERLTFSGDMDRWASLIGKLLIEYEKLGYITINMEPIRHKLNEASSSSSSSPP